MSGCYSIYGFEYKPAREYVGFPYSTRVLQYCLYVDMGADGFSNSGYITWVNDGLEAWTMRAPGTQHHPHRTARRRGMVTKF